MPLLSNVLFIYLWGQAESWETREGGDPAFVCDTPLSPLALVFILPLWPLTFQLPGYKKNRTQPEMARDIQRDQGWSSVLVSS